MNIPILEKEYEEPTRPYSQKELSFNRSRLFRQFRLGKNVVHHKKCQHFYIVRINGRKEREMLETKSLDVGNCSICWKLSKTPNHLFDKAYGIVEHYSERFRDYNKPDEFLTYRKNDLENVFYRWLYEDQSDRSYDFRRKRHFASEEESAKI